jgi:hypothetical protein
MKVRGAENPRRFSLRHSHGGAGRLAQANHSHDLIVYGGTAGGVMTAV